MHAPDLSSTPSARHVLDGLDRTDDPASPRRLLIVDPDEDQAIIAQLAIALSTQWEAHIAVSAKDALESCRFWAPHALLITLCGRDDVEAIQQLRQHPLTADLAMVVVGNPGRRAGEDPLPENDPGIRGHVPRPISPVTLAGDVARLLDWAVN